jgi:predicted CDP-diglyceride synthetase/phosphatidate cytidylyltransferase
VKASVPPEVEADIPEFKAAVTVVSLVQLKTLLSLIYVSYSKFSPLIAGYDPEYAESDGKLSLFSLAYIINPMPICFTLLMHWVLRADSLALLNTGSRIPARIPIIAITTNSSISVKPLLNFDILIYV